MNWKLRLLILLCWATGLSLSAQEYTQVLRGRITDADTGRPLAGATVGVPALGLGTATDTRGYYRLPGLEPGRYTIKASYLGYETMEVPEVLINTGQEVVLDFSMVEAVTGLATVTVRAPRAGAEGLGPNVRALTLEETLRFAATYYDPARLATALPGVVGTNDQANHLSVRGHSPNDLAWRLQGLEIVNPNHTPNAGNFSDRTTLNGGGVNALSAQLLDNSLFFNGAFPAGYGNALAAVMDMRLRPGNNEKREYTLQAGLIGIDLAAEGPFTASSNASYLVNYRYSFTGLLSDLGLQFGDEDIRFQDLSFHLSFPNERGGRWQLFGLFGNSRNRFTGPSAGEPWEDQKDSYEQIDYTSRLGVSGFSWEQPVGQRGQWRLAAALSALDAERLAAWRDSTTMTLTQENSTAYQQKLVLQAGYRHKLGTATMLQMRVEAAQHRADFRLPSAESPSGYYQGWLWQPSAQLRYRWDGWQLVAGLHLSHYTAPLTGQGSATYPEPRLSISWRGWHASYGLHSQLAPPLAHRGPATDGALPLRAHHTSFGWQTAPDEQHQLRVDAYWQQLWQVPVTVTPSAFSALNLLEEAPATALISNGEGRNAGLEVSYQRFAGDQWSYLFSASVYDARYRGSDDIWRDSRYNGRFALAATIGREWAGEDRKGQPRRLGINLATRYAGGLRAAPIDLAASRSAGRTVFNLEKGFSEQWPNFFRMDFRIYYQRNRANWYSTLALDLQNVTGQQNYAFAYYDRVQDGIVQRYQLELIPLLSYRIHF
ncbi:MAG: TonB-dependent receptor [Lewinella sp.]|nr:TonB-dependent receptor [Lewinella sp.]